MKQKKTDTYAISFTNMFDWRLDNWIPTILINLIQNNVKAVSISIYYQNVSSFWKYDVVLALLKSIII